MTETNISQARVIKCPNCGTGNRVRAAAPGVPYCGRCHQPLPWLVDADTSSFHAVVEESPIPVLVEFWAPWCGPCKMVAPVVEQLSRELAGRLKVAKVNSDDSPQLGQRFSVLGIPTLILIERGQVRDRLTGAVNAAALRSWVDRTLTSRQPG